MKRLLNILIFLFLLLTLTHFLASLWAAPFSNNSYSFIASNGSTVSPEEQKLMRSKHAQSSFFTQTKPSPKPTHPEPRAHTTPTIRHWISASGIPVYFISTNGLPMMDVMLTFNAGSAHDGKTYGLAALCSLLLNEGTEHYTATQIATAFENVGAQFSATLDRDKMSIALRTLTEDSILNAVLPVYGEIVSKPQFTETSITQIKNQTLSLLKKDLQNPRTIAVQTFYQKIYQDHPYAHPTSGTLQSVSLITRSDLVRFHKTYLTADNAILTLVGGVSEDKAKAIADQITQALPRGQKPAPLPAVLPLAEKLRDQIPFPSQQTHVIFGQPCGIYTDPDYYALLVGNYILGEGTLVARLFKEIRETRGLAYTVGSRFVNFKRPGPFLMYLQTKGSQSQKATQVMTDTLKEFLANGPTDEEIIAAKKGIIGGFPITIGNNSQLLAVISEMAFYGLPMDFLETFCDRIEQITKADVLKAFNTHLSPDKMALIIVGGE